MKHGSESRKRGSVGAWHSKKDWRGFILNFDPGRRMPDGCTAVKPLRGVEYQRFDEETQAWKPDPEAEARAKAAAERAGLLAEVAARDYRALKALKLGRELGDLYPGEPEWYRKTMERVRELEAVPGGGNEASGGGGRD